MLRFYNYQLLARRMFSTSFLLLEGKDSVAQNDAKNDASREGSKRRNGLFLWKDWENSCVSKLLPMC